MDGMHTKSSSQPHQNTGNQLVTRATARTLKAAQRNADGRIFVLKPLPRGIRSHHCNTESDSCFLPDRTGPDRISPLQHRVRQTVVFCWTGPDLTIPTPSQTDSCFLLDRTAPLQHRVRQLFSVGPDRTGPDLATETPSQTDSCFLLDRTGPDRTSALQHRVRQTVVFCWTGPNHCNTKSDRHLFPAVPNRTGPHHCNTASVSKPPDRTGLDR